ncbi:fatty acid desaturase [Pelagibacterium nitratireducens]|uniref:Fatty acid desaturase n=1 Tax=Pelagibacterium nitratireducens TaxID=1046114 RepID=A0ABZ2I0A8_9HYPH
MSDLAPDVASTERPWPQIMSRYRQPNRWRSAIELAISLAPFLLCWGLAWASVAYGFWWGLMFTIPAAGFLVRLFMIQHDCGHGAFFAHRQADDWAGRIIGVLTMTPYDYWRRTHAQHHATTGNLDRRGIGDVETLTVSEYRALSMRGRLRYRLYRHPIVLFGVGPLWLFLLQHRWPVGMMRSGVEPWLSTMATNVGIAVLAVGMVWVFGWQALVLVHLPIVIMAAAVGVWLFYVQHQFEETHWAPASDWKFKEAALHGSSYYDLPGILGWLTANIGIHHVHHLASRIPYYRLPEVLRDYPELKAIGRISIADSLAGVKLVLWDERRRKLVSFREALA